MQSPENQGSFGKDWSQQEERMQVQNETEQIYGGVSVPYRHVTCDPL